METTTMAYIAGFLDGDGCIMFQLVYRHDYIYAYQIRGSIVFYQKTVHRWILEWLKSILHDGYIRDRTDGMSEYTIVGIEPVQKILEELYPFLRLKKQHVDIARQIRALLPYRKRVDPDTLMKAATLVDRFSSLNYSKKRRNTSDQLKAELQKRGHIPRND